MRVDRQAARSQLSSARSPRKPDSSSERSWAAGVNVAWRVPSSRIQGIVIDRLTSLGQLVSTLAMLRAPTYCHVSQIVEARRTTSFE